MRKILLSVMTIGLVVVAGIGASRAFFSDVETSTDNVFQAGTLDLLVDNTCTYNGGSCDLAGPTGATGVLTSWEPTDLQDGVHKFFYFGDVKPGDEGEDTISLHVNNNDAWACMDISTLANDDNGCTEPESDPFDGNDSTCGSGQGELAQGLEFFAWNDINGDNIYQPQDPYFESYLFTNISGPASDVLGGRTYGLADSSYNVFTGSPGPLTGDTDYHIGLQWCAGDMSVNTGDGTITCNGNTMGNDTQSDSVTADLAFRVEQWRNNDTFTCQPL